MSETNLNIPVMSVGEATDILSETYTVAIKNNISPKLIPSVMMWGPPGVGKTTLANVVANVTKAEFVTFSAVTSGIREIKEIMARAESGRRIGIRTVLFVDEIDAIAKERRGGINDGGVEQTLTAFLTEMDGFANDPTKPVFVLAATNFDVEPGSAKSLDQALMRRFDRRIYIDLPDKDDRIRFLKKKISENKALDISEKELIESSDDNEYRKIKRDSEKFNKLKKILFWTLTIMYFTAILICFIVNLAVNNTISWFFIVLASILVAYSFCPTYTVFFSSKPFKLLNLSNKYTSFPSSKLKKLESI